MPLPQAWIAIPSPGSTSDCKVDTALPCSGTQTDSLAGDSFQFSAPMVTGFSGFDPEENRGGDRQRSFDELLVDVVFGDD